jgi:branched-chain amino acid transport system substrate-binding protein
MQKRIFQNPSSTKAICLGVVACQTGSMASYARTALQGLALGLDYATQGSNQVAGHPLELVIKDDQGEPHKGEQLARELIEQAGADLIVGCTSSPASIKISQVTRERGRLLMVAVGATDVLTGEWFNHFTFRTVANASQDAAAGAAYAATHLGKRFCFLAPDSLWGQQSRSAWWRVITRYGGEIVGDVIVSPDATEFRSYLHDVRAKAPDVLVVSWAGATTRDLIADIRASGLFEHCKVTGGLTDHDNIVALGSAIAGMICASKYYYEFPHNPVNDWLIKNHQERYGEAPDIFSESGFSAGLALVQALSRTEGNPNALGLIPVLEDMSYDGPKGVCTLRKEDHQSLQPMYVTELVMDAGSGYCVPHLIREVTAQDAAPAIVRPR